MMKTVIARAIVVAVVGAFVLSPAQATDYWVDGLDGIDTNDGLSATTAKKTIQAAVDLATTSGDVVNVLPAEYINGFAMTDIHGGVTIRGIGDVVIKDAQNSSLTNVTGARVETLTFLDGVSGQNGVAHLLISGCTDTLVERSRFLQGAGVQPSPTGMLAVTDGSTDVRIRECLFAHAVEFTSGVYVSQGAAGGDVRIDRCTFARNPMSIRKCSGGGCVPGTIIVDNCAFYQNTGVAPVGSLAYCSFFGEDCPGGSNIICDQDPDFIDPDSIVYYVKAGSHLLNQGQDGGPIGAFGQGFHSSKDMAKDEPAQGPTPWAGWVDQNGDAPAPVGPSTLVELNDTNELLLQEGVLSASIYSPVFDTQSEFTVIRSVDFAAYQDTAPDAGLREVIDYEVASPEREIRVRHSRTVNFSQLPFTDADPDVQIDPVDKHVKFRKRARYVQMELVLRTDGT